MSCCKRSRGDAAAPLLSVDVAPAPQRRRVVLSALAPIFVPSHALPPDVQVLACTAAIDGDVLAHTAAIAAEASRQESLAIQLGDEFRSDLLARAAARRRHRARAARHKKVVLCPICGKQFPAVGLAAQYFDYVGARYQRPFFPVEDMFGSSSDEDDLESVHSQRHRYNRAYPAGALAEHFATRHFSLRDMYNRGGRPLPATTGGASARCVAARLVLVAGIAIDEKSKPPGGWPLRYDAPALSASVASYVDRFRDNMASREDLNEALALRILKDVDSYQDFQSYEMPTPAKFLRYLIYTAGGDISPKTGRSDDLMDVSDSGGDDCSEYDDNDGNSEVSGCDDGSECSEYDDEEGDSEVSEDDKGSECCDDEEAGSEAV
jgi:hypothetical protein